MNHCGSASALVNLTMLIYDRRAMVKSTNQPNSWQMNELNTLNSYMLYDLFKLAFVQVSVHFICF